MNRLQRQKRKRQAKSQVRLSGVISEEHPARRGVPAAVVVHELLARAVAEFRQVRGRVLQHQSRPLVQLGVLMTFQRVQHLRAVAANAQALVLACPALKEKAVCPGLGEENQQFSRLTVGSEIAAL